ncbi:hypothetical protein GIB67_029468 [Kingdonia uniflora]|uniref:glucose-1-phosphate adenylyltransferase n=1 Tax=Kingdonia uniflora TaxID=39325 RepID=A0A7J7NY79_9MAGN|nr:hypothetical protein GIB67_029468 [Kingdonia uniflora]
MKVDTTILGVDDERAKGMPYIASMGIYVVSKNVMLNLLRDKFPGTNDFGSEVIPGATSIGMRVGVLFNLHDLRVSGDKEEETAVVEVEDGLHFSVPSSFLVVFYRGMKGKEVFDLLPSCNF